MAAGRDGRSAESVDTNLAIAWPRHKHLHIASIAASSGAQRDASTSEHRRSPEKGPRHARVSFARMIATKQNAHSKVGVAVEAGTSEYLVAGAGFEPTTFGL